MKPEQKGKRLGVGLLLAALGVLMMAVLPGRAGHGPSRRASP